jgi:hypothetical protein
MEPLPPVDLQKYDDQDWVLDGHNRIAAALYEGQLVVDAVVQEIVPPGAARRPCPSSPRWPWRWPKERRSGLRRPA